MSLEIPAIQKTLAIEQIDGWLLYDFKGSNPIAVELAGLAGKHTTRRWYYFIPASGRPKKLVHAIEPFHLDHLEGDKMTYAGRAQLEQGVIEITRGAKVVAMEYSPECAIPYLSRVDGGSSSRASPRCCAAPRSWRWSTRPSARFPICPA